MNQRGSMNQRTDELERILNASKVNYSSPQVSQQPTLYEVQRGYAEDLKQLRQQFEESQQKQEIKDREQAKENRVNRWLTVASLLVATVSMAAAIISLFM
uniref:Uncharacterized protein n=1 Tax=Siphoviridae sp. ctXPH7 TaxID=2826367 RepID=A0A8S5LY54_9CAUD|nr:MAG TPA: hypothetical protein [Siphoviridae sp. ctXPH7]